MRGIGNYTTGFTQRLENLANDNGHGKAMERDKLAKSHGILISVIELDQFLSSNFSKFVHFWLTSRNLAWLQKVHIFQPFPQNVENTKIE